MNPPDQYGQLDPPEPAEERSTADTADETAKDDNQSEAEDRGGVGPTRSVYNVVYEADDDDLQSEDPSEYLEEIDLPLPVITDSESSRWSRFGQCCDCCDTCLRKHAWIMSCDCIWVKVAFYYFILNLLVMGVFLFTMYMTQVEFDKSPDFPPYQQLLFKRKQHPGVSLVPSMANLKSTPISIITYGHKGNDKELNRLPDTYIKAIDDLKYANKKYCELATACVNDESTWGPCESSDYGYSENKPCLFLKLNKLNMWLPEEYQSESKIPNDVPKDLVSKIDVSMRHVWVHCEGETPYDRDKIGAVEYFPGPFFNSTHFPTSSMKGSNPLITVKLNNYKRGYIAKLVCGLYAGNVHKKSAHFAYIYIKHE